MKKRRIDIIKELIIRGNESELAKFLVAELEVCPVLQFNEDEMKNLLCNTKENLDELNDCSKCVEDFLYSEVDVPDETVEPIVDVGKHFNELKELILCAKSCFTCNHRYQIRGHHRCFKHNFRIRSIEDVKSNCGDYCDEV